MQARRLQFALPAEDPTAEKLRKEEEKEKEMKERIWWWRRVLFSFSSLALTILSTVVPHPGWMNGAPLVSVDG